MRTFNANARKDGPLTARRRPSWSWLGHPGCFRLAFPRACGGFRRGWRRFSPSRLSAALYPRRSTAASSACSCGRVGACGLPGSAAGPVRIRSRNNAETSGSRRAILGFHQGLVEFAPRRILVQRLAIAAAEHVVVRPGVLAAGAVGEQHLHQVGGERLDTLASSVLRGASVAAHPVLTDGHGVARQKFA